MKSEKNPGRADGGLIAMIEPVGAHGGMNYYDTSLCNELAAFGVPVSLYTHVASPAEPEVSFRRIYAFSGIFGPRNKFVRGLRFLAQFSRVLVDILKRKIRLVHFHYFHADALGLIGVVFARLSGRKIVVTVHDVSSLASERFGFVSHWIYNFADELIVHNFTSRNELLKKSNVPPGKVNVIAHGEYASIVSDRKMVEISRSRVGIPVQARVVLFFGQIKDVKGLDILIRAFPSILKKVPDALLLIAGRPWRTDFSKYQAMIDENGIANKVISKIEYIPDEEVDHLFISADVIALPYRRIYQSGVLLNAMSKNVPVVVSDLEAMKEIVSHKVNGSLFRSGDPDDLADKLIEILGDPVLGSNLRKEAKAALSLNHSWKTIARETAHVYSRLLKTEQI